MSTQRAPMSTQRAPIVSSKTDADGTTTTTFGPLEAGQAYSVPLGLPLRLPGEPLSANLREESPPVRLHADEAQVVAGLSDGVSMESLIDRAKRLQAEKGITAVAALRLARGQIESERRAADILEPINRRRITETATHGSEPGTVLSLFIDGEQIAAAMSCSQYFTEQMHGMSWHVITSLPFTRAAKNRAMIPPPALVDDRAAAELWLNFLGDLYENRFTS